jgi:hypothetical protein
MGWREDHRRVSNGEQYLAVTGAALRHPVSRQESPAWGVSPQGSYRGRK